MPQVTGTGGALNRQLNNERDGLVSTPYDRDLIDRGYGFALEQNFSITAGATLYILIDYSTYTDFTPSNIDNRDPKTKRDGTIRILPPAFGGTVGPFVINVYRNSDYSGGTPTNYAKMNTKSDVDPQITITQGATGTTTGDEALEYLVGSTGSIVSPRGGTSVGSAVFVRTNVDTTLVEIINNSASDGKFHYGQIFIEI